ncbi:MAG: hypothetical protein Kow00107_07430 [Planctomycetota bacterium]
MSQHLDVLAGEAAGVFGLSTRRNALETALPKLHALLNEIFSA